MRIHKGTFKIRDSENDQPVWTFYEGSYGNDYPFYVHRKSRQVVMDFISYVYWIHDKESSITKTG